MIINLTTKFNLNDTIYFISDTTKRIIEAKVTEIVVYVEEGNLKTYYKTEPFCMVKETECYSSKEEVINQLI